MMIVRTLLALLLVVAAGSASAEVNVFPDRIDLYANEPVEIMIRVVEDGRPLPDVTVNFIVYPDYLTITSGLLTKTDADGYARAQGRTTAFVGAYGMRVSLEGSNRPIGVRTLPVRQATRPEPTPSGSTYSSTLVGANASGKLTYSLPDGIRPPRCELRDPRMLDPAQPGLPDVPPPNNLRMDSLFTFTLQGCTQPQEQDAKLIRFEVELPYAPPPDAGFYVYGKHPTSAEMKWYKLNATVSGRTLIFTTTDTADGDFDRVRNDVVRIVGGMAVPTPYSDIWWAGPEENGWGFSLVQHHETSFGVLYAYDDAGKPTWHVLPNASWGSDRKEVSGPFYLPQGTPFFAYDASRFTVGSDRGVMIMDFTAPDRATFITGSIGIPPRSRSIMRHRFGSEMPTAFNLTDMWWGGPSQNGWGIAIVQQGSSLFSVWFTYDETGERRWFVMPAGEWTAGDTYQGRIYRTTGTPWSAAVYDPSKFKVTDVGAFKFRFAGNTASFDYAIDGRSGQLSLTRQSF